MDRLNQVVTTGCYVRSSCRACGHSTWTTSAPELAQCSRCRHGYPTPDMVSTETIQQRESAPLASCAATACPICFEDIGVKMNYASTVQNESWANSDCCDGHLLCKPCVQRYVEIKVLEEGLWNIRCPGKDCRYRLIDDDIREALTDSCHQQEVVDKRARLRNENFAPRLQELLAARSEVLTDCSEALLLAECQVCPTCSVLVRREGGCTHIVCRCGQEFCFGCGAPYSEDEGDSCVCGERDDGGVHVAEDDMEGEGRPSLGFWRQYKGLSLVGPSEAVPEQDGTIEMPALPELSVLVRASTEHSLVPDKLSLGLGLAEPLKLYRAKSLPTCCT